MQPCATQASTMMPGDVSNGSLPVAKKDDTDMAGKQEHNQIGPVAAIIGHRHKTEDKTLFELRVQWKDGDLMTWEPESFIQEHAEDTLFKYWDAVEGGRLGAMFDKTLWHPLKIKAHRQTNYGAVRLEVEWVGSRQTTWESEEHMESFAPEHLKEYWKSKGGRNIRKTMPAKKREIAIHKRLARRREAGVRNRTQPRRRQPSRLVKRK
ncbi:hypothetical protein CSUB01_08013 [Colletotrichum sublineola]|uniref:Chromo domain-containing protein n=1 Tax=Colletotrichum sublineola TaxID=1173701 RepID=A0A066WTK4_COLSU|nr:hypothetical protein CSUB01_08013 [Colletotrichum sublineola]